MSKVIAPDLGPDPESPNDQYVYGICGASSDDKLLLEISKRIAELEEEHGVVILLSISHCVERAGIAPLWTALITCEVGNTP